ncbi:5-(carboxyamino)imidazole ribonucleotide mutase [Endozoicomonas sp. OPT23]|uniref:5-(carboxyamino)imidazole ribonucleotide mutase n=1 Tax=Endozoicomonas sp. OPT23 TaxID=2072845 RepID=UPI00129BFC09|nr:5-(carboxyamino)imidazole ribonucleotide mutase [Endozoicomonas sp. OPT23]MRI33370.1 5-(carboxyamino)imidazole ribonucleotide mutase [Endozoicomonas sp. OPT23]
MIKPFVAILMDSDSDLPVAKAALEVLKNLGIQIEVKVHSALRTPDIIRTYVADADKRGVAAYIACAGMSAHLAGVVASLTVKPVIGVPVSNSSLDGMDALLSTVQMPGGTPVATVAIGETGARNAGYLAAQIIALGDKELANRLRMERQASAEEVLAKDAALQQQLAG